jgi:hypothetical protein
MSLSVFICYRELDTGHAAGRINYWLKSKLQDDVTLFMDVDSIRKGDDFVEKLNAAIQETDVLLAIIGPRWLDATDGMGNRRIDLEDDFVRMEIAAAIQRNIAIMPVMIDGAKPLKQRELPNSIAKLARYNGVEIRSRSFETDAAVLVRELQNRKPPRASFYERFRKRATAKAEKPSESKGPTKTEPGTTSDAGASRKTFETMVKKKPKIVIIVGAILLAIALFTIFSNSNSPGRPLSNFSNGNSPSRPLSNRPIPDGPCGDMHGPAYEACSKDNGG